MFELSQQMPLPQYFLDRIQLCETAKLIDRVIEEFSALIWIKSKRIPLLPNNSVKLCNVMSTLESEVEHSEIDCGMLAIPDCQPHLVALHILQSLISAALRLTLSHRLCLRCRFCFCPLAINCVSATASTSFNSEQSYSWHNSYTWRTRNDGSDRPASQLRTVCVLTSSASATWRWRSFLDSRSFLRVT